MSVASGVQQLSELDEVATSFQKLRAGRKTLLASDMSFMLSPGFWDYYVYYLITHLLHFSARYWLFGCTCSCQATDGNSTDLTRL